MNKLRRRRRGCDERAGSSSDEPSGAGAASGRGKGQPRTAERRGRGTIGKAGFEANTIEAPPSDPLAAIKAELWRWHLGRVFVHQFALMARRIVPLTPETQKKRDDGTGRGLGWQRRKFGKTPELGLVAFKHQQNRARRAAITGSFQAAERAADERKPPPDDGGAARGADRGRSRQAARLRK